MIDDLDDRETLAATRGLRSFLRTPGGGSFDNADGGLFPKQFVNIQLVQEVPRNQIIIPSSAVRRGAPNGAERTFVYVVNSDRTKVRPVTLGTVDGERVAVDRGLAVGEVVVTEGGDRLRDGAEVQLPIAAPVLASTGDSRRRTQARPAQ